MAFSAYNQHPPTNLLGGCVLVGLRPLVFNRRHGGQPLPSVRGPGPCLCPTMMANLSVVTG